MQYRMVVLPLGTERGLVPLVACAVPPVPCWARRRERQTLMHTRRKAVIAITLRRARTLVALAAGAFILECLTKEAL
jgi:hypothetical protein